MKGDIFMWRKLLIILVVLSTILVFTSACSEEKKLPTSLSLEESIKQIITTKGENYDFLKDEAYMKHMEILGMELVNNKEAIPPHYALGNLDDDNIPELAIFKERNQDNMNDEGSLEIYKFNGEEYVSIDKISMNYDNTNYQIVIGKISENQNGLYLNNSVGAHSGITYGFVLENSKLKSILNDQKISLISIYSRNEIKDIDNDGVLEFSIYTVDPETEDSTSTGSDKITLWYKWNGKDSATLVDVNRKDYSKLESNKEIFAQGESLIENNFNEALVFLGEHKGDLSKYDNTQLLKKYISKLNELSFDLSVEVNNLFITYQKDGNHDYLLEKYGLSIEELIKNLNSMEYLKREKVLKEEEELKKHLIDKLPLGYKLYTSEGIYYYIIDYEKLVNLFNENITNEYKDFLKILALDSNKPYLNDGRLTISMEILAERILFVESFKMIYPYSELLPQVDHIYSLYIYHYFYGDSHVSNYEEDTFKIKDEVLKEFKLAIEKYPYTTFGGIVSDFVRLLEENNYIVNDDLRNKFNEILD